MSKTAVVLIHGIGNQRPMETLRNFIDNIKDPNDLVFNNPDKIANFHETRRISIAQRNVDFYEYYWANLMSEPTSLSLYRWLILVMKRTNNARINWLLRIIQFICILIVLTVFYMVYISLDFPNFCPQLFDLYNAYIKKYLIYIHTKIILYSEFGRYVFLIIKHIVFIILVAFFLGLTYLKLVGNSILSVLGDAFKYLAPIPQNINDRYKIRQNGLQLLKNLHELKDSNGVQLYDKIIIVGHSLGSVIGYDLIRHLWPDYVRTSNFIVNPLIRLAVFSKLYLKFTENPSDLHISTSNFQTHQSNIFDELKSTGNEWRISNFITLGSPLYLIPFLYTENKESFNERVKIRELVTCPPQIQRVKKDKSNNPPIFDNVQPISFYEGKNEFINHSSPFAFIKWNNLYFENDYIGGELIDLGKGIDNRIVPFKGRRNFFKRFFPCGSHSQYWNKEIGKDSINFIRNTIF